MDYNEAFDELRLIQRSRASRWLRPRINRAVSKLQKRLNKRRTPTVYVKIPWRIAKLAQLDSEWSFSGIAQNLLRERGITATIVTLGYLDSRAIQLVIDLRGHV